MNHYNRGGPTLDSRLDSYHPIRNPSFEDNFLTSFRNRVNDMTYDSQINYTLVGIISKKTDSDTYIVADHVANADTLVIYDSEKGTRQYVSIDFGSQRPDGTPGIDLIEYIKTNYPDLEILVTGIELVYQNKGNIKNETAEPGTDIEDIIEKYGAKSEKTGAKDDRKDEEYDIEPDENYDPEEQDPDAEPSESDLEGELVGAVAECEAEGEASESAE